MFCFKIFFESFSLRKLFFEGGAFENFWRRLTVQGGGSGQSISLVSGREGGGSKIGKNSVSWYLNDPLYQSLVQNKYKKNTFCFVIPSCSSWSPAMFFRHRLANFPSPPPRLLCVWPLVCNFMVQEGKGGMRREGGSRGEVYGKGEIIVKYFCSSVVITNVLKSSQNIVHYL